MKEKYIKKVISACLLILAIVLVMPSLLVNGQNFYIQNEQILHEQNEKNTSNKATREEEEQCEQEEQNISIRINSELLEMSNSDYRPLIVENRVMVPLRIVMEALGFWVQDHGRMMVARSPEYTIRIHPGFYNIWLNNEEIQIDVPAQVIEGVTMIPLRDITELLDMEIKWDSENLIVDIIADEDLEPWTRPLPEPVIDWPEHLPRHVPGSIILHPEESFSRTESMKFRDVFYHIPCCILSLADTRENSSEWFASLEERHLEYAIVMLFVQDFNITREEFDGALERHVSLTEHIRHIVDLNDELFELPNADIIYTFDNDIIRYFFRRE